MSGRVSPSSRIVPLRRLNAAVAVGLVLALDLLPITAQTAAASGDALPALTAYSEQSEAISRTVVAPSFTFYDPARFPATGPITYLSTNFHWASGSPIISTADATQLEVGTYPIGDGTGGAVRVWIGGAHATGGTVSILQLDVVADTLAAVAFDLTYTLNGSAATNHAAYRYKSSVPLDGPDVGPISGGYSQLDFGLVVGGTTTPPAPVTVSNLGTTTFNVAGVALSGARTAAFAIVSDTCSGTILAPGDTCTVGVTVTPDPAGAWEQAVLTFAVPGLPDLHERLTANGMTATTCSITVPDEIPAGMQTTLTASILPAEAAAKGWFGWTVDGVYLGNPGHVTLALGTHELKAHFDGTSYWSSPRAADCDAVKTVTAKVDAHISISGPTNPLAEGQQAVFSASFWAGASPAFGTLTIKNADTGATLATMPVTSYQAVLDTPLQILPAGDTHLVASFTGDPTFMQPTATYTASVTPDTEARLLIPALTPSTFYPAKDGYRDTVRISASGGEPLTFVATIRNSAGRTVRTLNIGTVNGPWSRTWNGLRADGTRVPSGTYTVHWLATDAKGNKATADRTLHLSWRRVTWLTASATKTGSQYSLKYVRGTGRVSTSASSFSRGVKLTGGTTSGSYADAIWVVAVKPALAYRSATIAVLGRGTTSSSRGLLFFLDQTMGRVIGPGYAWYSRHDSRSHVSGGSIAMGVEAQGPMKGAFDIAKVKVTYQYAVWR